MKNLIVFAAVFLGVSFFGCQDSRDESNAQPDVAFIKSIGTRITFETGMRWMDTYNKKENIQGRVETGTPPYAISAVMLQTLRLSTLDLSGIAFHHAIDNAGEHHFIVIPVNSSLSLWSFSLGRLYIDANSNTIISRSQAHEWADNYIEQNPDEVWFHFFGNDIFDEISLISFFTTMQIEPAINDADLSPQLLLIIEDELAAINGRYKTSSTVIYDASSPCPPCPVN